MRRLGTLIATLALVTLTIAPMAAADPPARVDLIKSFNNGLQTGGDIFPDGRIRPFADLLGEPMQSFCSDEVLGYWLFVAQGEPTTTRAELASTTLTLTIDGLPLVGKYRRSPIKRNRDGVMWFAEGVPVLQSLSVGVHTAQFETTWSGDPVPWIVPVVFEVTACP